MSDTPTLPPPPANPPSTALSIVPFPPAKQPKKSPPKKVAASAPPATQSTGNGNGNGTEPSRAATGRSLVLSSAITKRDRDRWRKWRDGQSEDEIALGEKKDVLTVRKSIQKYLSYQYSVSHEAVDMKANELTIGTLDQLGAVIDDVLKAEKEVTFKNAEGKEESRFVPDLKMRLTAFDKIVDLIQAVRKKDGLVINQNNTQNNVLVNQQRKGLTVEERIRAVREKNRLRNDDDQIMDAEFEEEEDDEEYEEGDEVEEGDESGEDSPEE